MKLYVHYYIEGTLWFSLPGRMISTSLSLKQWEYALSLLKEKFYIHKVVKHGVIRWNV